MSCDNLIPNGYKLVDYDYIKKIWETNRIGLANCESQVVNSQRTNGFSRADLYIEIFLDQRTNGFLMNYPYGLVICQGETGGYYRGENQIYPKSQPTYFRKLETYKTDEDKNVYTFLSKMRIQAFKRIIDRTNVVKEWINNGLDVLYEPLAQHYGLDTTWLDITSDFRVALFFATCTYDYSNRKWRPLNKEEIENYKYGVIFSQTGFMAKISNLPVTDGSPQNLVFPIGYQPFMRCHTQHGYGIKMDNPYPLQDDPHFEKLCFEHSEELSNAVFNEMNKGMSIYPNEGLDTFYDVIENIKESNRFNKESFYNVFDEIGLFDTKDKAIAVLENHNIFLDSENKLDFGATTERINELNERYKDFSLEKDYGITLSTRLVYR